MRGPLTCVAHAPGLAVLRLSSEYEDYARAQQDLDPLARRGGNGGLEDSSHDSDLNKQYGGKQ